MLYQIASFLLDVVGGLLTGACLLRLYMQWQRVPFSNPVGGLVFALTDWLIMPLRRVIPPTRGALACRHCSRQRSASTRLWPRRKHNNRLDESRWNARHAPWDDRPPRATIHRRFTCHC